jgi:quercetin dioxygenase-like cupin family protein
MSMTAGVTQAGTGEGGVVWSILGQTYKPVAHSESCFAFDTLFPPGTFVPPHIHTNQDEFIRVLEGQFDLFLDGQAATAKAGDLIRCPWVLPMASSTKPKHPCAHYFG